MYQNEINKVKQLQLNCFTRIHLSRLINSSGVRAMNALWLESHSKGRWMGY